MLYQLLLPSLTFKLSIIDNENLNDDLTGSGNCCQSLKRVITSEHSVNTTFNSNVHVCIAGITENMHAKLVIHLIS